MREELPAFPVVLGLIRPPRADAQVDALGIAWVDLNRMDAGIAAAGARPVLAGGVPVDSLHGPPGMAPVLAAEQAGRLRSREHDSGLARVARRHAPDVADRTRRGVAPFARSWALALARQPGDEVLHVRWEGKPLTTVVPRLAEVCALGDRWPPGPVVRGGVEPGWIASHVSCHVMERPAWKDGLRYLPLLAPVVGGVYEAPLLGADEQSGLSSHYGLLSSPGTPGIAGCRWRGAALLLRSGSSCSHSGPF